MQNVKETITSTEKFVCRARNLLNEKYEEKFVCFVDAQGTKKAFRDSKVPVDVALPNLIFNYAKEANDEYAKNLQIVHFSDCAYIVADKNNIEAFLLYISLLYFELLTFNISSKYRLLRGGITFGNVYCNPEFNCIVGSSVTDAYELENSDWLYPRIILDDNGISVLKNCRNEFQWVSIDPIDNICYLDFLAVVKQHRKITPNMLADTLKWVEKVLYTEEKERTLKKYEWMKNYINRKMSEWSK